MQEETGRTMILGQLRAAGYTASQAQDVIRLAERMKNSFDFRAYAEAQSMGCIRDIERLVGRWRAVSPDMSRLSDLSSEQVRQMLDRRDFLGFMGPQERISLRWLSPSAFDLMVDGRTSHIELPAGSRRARSAADRNRDDFITLETARSMAEVRQAVKRRLRVPRRTP